MSRTETKSTSLLIGGLIATTLLITAQVWARSPAPAPVQAVPVLDQPADALVRLDAMFDAGTLIGTVTVSGKDGRPARDARGQAHLLDPSGEPVAAIPLQPLGPGLFRLVAPLERLGVGYLDVRLSGPGWVGELGSAYQVDRDQRAVRWVKAAPGKSAPLAAQATGGPDEFGYTWDDSATYTWIDTSGGKSLTLRDDDWAGPLDIGFTFNFYGQNYTQFYVDSNGYIGFDDTQTWSYFIYNFGRLSGRPSLPNAHRPNNLIAPFWTDFDPSEGGTIRYQTLGTAPNRSLVVEWSQLPFYYTPDAQSFQVILYEGSNDIKFQYPATRQGSYGDLTWATTGIENADGTIALEYLDTISTTLTRTILLDHNQLAYNVFLSPEHQGSSAAAGEAASFYLRVTNLGANSDSFTLSRPAYTGSDWAVSFYESDGTTPLSGNNTGTIATGDEAIIVTKVNIPSGATAGEWTRATIRATSQGNPSEYHDVLLDATLGTSFVQIYTDDESADDTEDSENYFDALREGHRYSRRVTTDEDDSESNYIAVATNPNGNAVNVWTKTYYNGMAWVDDLEYAILDGAGDFVRSVTRLTNNSGATETSYDFGPAVDVAPNGSFVIGWNRQPGTFNVWYAVMNQLGDIVKAPTPLTNNTTDYPRDYPPTVAALTGGRFILAWEHAAASEGAVDIYYAILNNDGSIQKSTTSLTDGTGRNYTPRAAALRNGEAAIVWMAENNDRYPEIYYVTVDSSGKLVSGPDPITSNGASGAGSYYPDAVGLSDGRLGVAWTQYIGDELQTQYTIISPSQVTPTPTNTPTSTPSPSGGIQGKVTYQSSPISGINVILRFYDGADWSTTMTTTTQIDGTYVFTNAPGLATDQIYYARYNNGENGNADDDNYLWFQRGLYIESYAAGSAASGGDFDIANIPLVAPSSAATVSLPSTFQWITREISSDHYRFSLYCDADAVYHIYDDVGTANSYTFYGPPPTCAGQLRWLVRVYPTDGTDYRLGYGQSYYARAVNFASRAASADGVTESISPLSDSPADTTSLHAPRQNHGPPDNESAPPAPLLGAASGDIYTVTNDLSADNIYVSITTDEDDNLIMTWLDNADAQYLFYALADDSGTIRTPTTVFQRTRHSFLWSSWNGYGNDSLVPRTVEPTGPHAIYLPAVIANYPPIIPTPTPTQTPIPVTNGGFESGTFSGWTRGSDTSSSDRPAPKPRVVDSRSHKGTYSAVLGQENDPCVSIVGEDGYTLRSWIYQDIWVPTSGSPQLTLWYRIFSYDKLNQDKYDRFEIYINGTLLTRLGNTSSNYGCSEPINDLGWRKFTYDLAPYKGQTIRLTLVNITNPDKSYSTWTYVDDIKVTH